MTAQYQYNFVYFPTDIKMDPLEFEALSHDEKAISFGKDFTQARLDCVCVNRYRGRSRNWME